MKIHSQAQALYACSAITAIVILLVETFLVVSGSIGRIHWSILGTPIAMLLVSAIGFFRSNKPDA